MIERLSHGPASAHGLTEPFALSQLMISKHIACLVRAQIVIKKKRGQESLCRLRPEAIKTVSDWAFSYRRFWKESFDKLEVVVNQMKKANEERGDQKWQKTRLLKLSGCLSHEFLMPHASWFGRRGQTRSTSCSGGDRRALLRRIVRWIFALEENFSAA
jgi:DNA-binding transcriptional ArsR family regulator